MDLRRLDHRAPRCAPPEAEVLAIRPHEDLLPRRPSPALQRRLAFRVGASERDAGGQHNFDGLGELEQDADYGRTFAAANGSLRGDLTLVFGNVGSSTTLVDVQEGRASVLDLNPFREIGAQFDLAIFEDADDRNAGIAILRIRAAYLGLFDRVQGGDSAGVAGESQLGCGVGVKW
ncbi:MAG: hypothetical protein JKY65_33975 [Planctomycetes bacterium]|nr:hypothetical protein [Planctomycetota bacterium]